MIRCCLLLLFFTFDLCAEELINRFHSDIEINRAGEINVTETIAVYAENIHEIGRRKSSEPIKSNR